MVGSSKKLRSVLELIAWMANVLMEDDYSRATLAMREMSIEQALEHVELYAASYQLSADDVLPPAERLIDLVNRQRLAMYRQAGVEFIPEAAARLKWELENAVAILPGGSIHDHFWHWLDRFYYEIYRPWRATRQSLLENQERQAITVLGAREKDGAAPEIDWLSAKNPLHGYPGLRKAVQSGQFKVYFWVEPFGLPDTWVLLPGVVLVSFADPGEIFENFYTFAASVASRSQALADPTRLVILRLIRYIGMTNTDMANYLGLSQPTVSVHARILREAGLIRSHQEGRIVKHEIVSEELRRLFRDLERFLDLP